MILFFHFICLLAQYIVSNISKSISNCKIHSDDENEEDFKNPSEIFFIKKEYVKEPVYEDGSLKFFPPVYFQRYETVALILQDPALKGKIRKVVDFGCSELGFFTFLKNLEEVNEILEVDIDEDLLQRYAYKAAPLTSDYLMSKATKPLDVYILAGNIADYDDHLIGTDVVVAIELIEHLNEKDFQKMPFNVFHKIKPKLAIFTTPNADFNSLFPNFTGFRHDDHKFEWTRKEFFKWTQEIIKQYPEYSVRFFGIGAGPDGTENLGCCSQMALFQRSEEADTFASAREESGGIHNYKLIEHFNYPVYKDERTTEEKIMHEVQYQMSHILTLSDYYDYEKNEVVIPLIFLKKYIVELCPDEEEFRNTLEKNGMKIEFRHDQWYLIYPEPDFDSSDGSLSCDDSSPEKFESDNCVELLNENWDLVEEHLEDITNYQSARSLEKLESGINEFQQPNSIKTDCDRFVESKETLEASIRENYTKSAPGSLGHLKKHLDIPKDCSSNTKNKLLETKQNYSVKSKIPRKNISKKTEENTVPVECVHKTVLSNVCNPSRKMSKSFSLDSSLKNINSRPKENESFYLNLIPGSSMSNRNNSSFSSYTAKYIMNDSGSSLYSSSLDRAVDSGYPFSFSPPDADLTPEQVDEIFTENEISSRSSSVSSEVKYMDDDIHQRNLQIEEFFAEDLLVENGDLANNNRDGEGNNVEGLIGQRLVNELAAERDPNDNMMFFPEIQEFPPWLLNLIDLAEHPFFFPLNIVHDENLDEGVGEDSNSDLNQSPDPEEID